MLIGDNSFEKMLHALIIKASRDGLTDAAFVLTKLKESPENASKIRESIENPPKTVIVMTPEECLATVLEMRLSQRAYKKLRKRQKQRHAKIFVSWQDVLKVKRKSEPKDIDDKTKVGVVQVPMKSVVNHQITKIMEKPYILFCIGKIQNIADGTKTEADHSLLHCRFF